MFITISRCTAITANSALQFCRMLAAVLGQEYFETHRLYVDHYILCITIRHAKSLTKFLASGMA